DADRAIPSARREQGLPGWLLLRVGGRRARRADRTGPRRGRCVVCGVDAARHRHDSGGAGRREHRSGGGRRAARVRPHRLSTPRQHAVRRHSGQSSDRPGTPRGGTPARGGHDLGSLRSHLVEERERVLENSLTLYERVDMTEPREDDGATSRDPRGCLRAPFVLELARDDEYRRGDPREEGPRRPVGETLESACEDLVVGRAQVLPQPLRYRLVAEDRLETVGARGFGVPKPLGWFRVLGIDGSQGDQPGDAIGPYRGQLEAEPGPGGVTPECEPVKAEVVGKRDDVRGVVLRQVATRVGRRVTCAVSPMIEEDDGVTL